MTTAVEMIAAAREHGLHLALDGAELDGSGADFLVLHAADEQGVRWVVRSPRRADVHERAAAERRALELVGGRLPLAVPEWRVFSARFIAYPRLGGEPTARADMEPGGYRWRFDAHAPPPAFLDSLAGALAALHAIPPAEALAAGLRQLRPDEVRAATAARMERAREVLSVPDALWRRWQGWLTEESYWPGHATLVHGDLHPPHTLVDGEHRVVGLLDWTEGHVGDAATDFALLHATMEGAALAALLERYAAAGGRVPPRMEEHVVETWAAYPAMIAEFALPSGEEGPRRLAQSLVDATVAEMSGSAG